MNIRHTPDTVAAPFGPYSHAVEVPEGSRLLYISGEVGVLPDGTVPKGIEAQAEACWRNIIAILADARMGVGDLVKITTYLVRPEDVAAAVRFLCGPGASYINGQNILVNGGTFLG